MHNKSHCAIHSVIVASLLAIPLVTMPAVAFAEAANTPSSGTQTGSGQTVMRMIIQDSSEHGGTTDDQNNQDSGNDGLGDNLAFTVPSSINYVVQADGDLIGPSAGVAFIENRSVFPTHVSSVQVINAGTSGASGFTFVTSVATDTSTANAVELHFGPADDQLNAADYATKGAVLHKPKWNMVATNGAHTGSSDRTDEVQLVTSGKVARIGTDIRGNTKFGEIHWYLTPGEAPEPVNISCSTDATGATGFSLTQWPRSEDAVAPCFGLDEIVGSSIAYTPYLYVNGYHGIGYLSSSTPTWGDIRILIESQGYDIGNVTDIFIKTHPGPI